MIWLYWLNRASFLPATLTALLIFLGGMACGARAAGVGNPAPPLALESFVKGTALAQLPTGRVSVVSFWATWGGDPSAMALSKMAVLASEYPAVTFLAVDVWDSQGKSDAATEVVKARAFVHGISDDVPLAIALDAVLSRDKNDTGAMARTWLTGSGQEGLPAAFVVGRDGRIEWIGNPAEIDEPLRRVVARRWDRAAAVAQFQAAQAKAARTRAVGDELAQARRLLDQPLKALTLLDAALATDPALEADIGVYRFKTLYQIGDTTKTLAYGNRLVDTLYSNDASALNAVAWTMADPMNHIKPGPSLIPLVLRAAQRADTLRGGKDPAILETLAAAQFAAGSTRAAVQTQQQAMAAAKGTSYEHERSLKTHLKLYSANHS